MLFSEPKIPQYIPRDIYQPQFLCFSALQRAENSSITANSSSHSRPVSVSVLFSEPKIPQSQRRHRRRQNLSGFSALQRAENSSIHWLLSSKGLSVGFSALQRAENSSIIVPRDCGTISSAFQCSSASRKFLNATEQSNAQQQTRFSALQRAENSSMFNNRYLCACGRVSVLFSEPKIPQFHDILKQVT